MFFILPGFDIILWVYLIAALGPAIYLMGYIYNQDKIEKEPGWLLWRCIGMGVLAALFAIVLEMIGDEVLDLSPIRQDSVIGVMLSAYLVVAVVEEGMKYLLMGKATWNNQNFNYRFDGIVYAAFTSLGFAAFENVGYVFRYGMGTALTRAFTSIPGHLGFSVLFGCFYGRARLAANEGRKGKAAFELIFGYILAVFLHGTYDTCAMIQSGKSTLIFVAIIVVLYIIVFRLVKHESRTDRFI
ncbi:MAG: PrsW family glutamic-type intramembrane protease [Lachnospiraceae bacterium]|nr:PrsW family glutamic-type intramembrane protease [Lachnospiraceae bacterium]